MTAFSSKIKMQQFSFSKIQLHIDFNQDFNVIHAPNTDSCLMFCKCFYLAIVFSIFLNSLRKVHLFLLSHEMASYYFNYCFPISGNFCISLIFIVFLLTSIRKHWEERKMVLFLTVCQSELKCSEIKKTEKLFFLCQPC